MARPTHNPPRTPKADRPPRRFGIRTVVVLLLIAAAGAWIASGFHVVEPDQRAVVRLFGRITEPAAESGVHFAWPWPFGRMDKVNIAVRRVTIGLSPGDRTAIAAGDLVAQSQSTRTDVFTGDVNIVKATIVAQYQIAKPDQYLTRCVNPDALVEQAVQIAMVRTLGAYPVDEAITSGKAAIEFEVTAAAREMLAGLHTGIALSDVSIDSIEPPFAIIDAFKNVASAKKNQEREIDQAHAFADSILPRARGQAAEELASASGYYQQRVNQAKGETDRFRAILAEYERAPLVTRTRLLINTLTNVYSRAETYVYSANEDGPPLRLTIGDDR